MSEEKAAASVTSPTTPAQQVTAAADGTRRSVIEDFASPIHYFAHLHSVAIEGFDRVIELAKQDAQKAAANAFGTYMSWAKSIVEVSGRELALLRALEHHIVKNTLTEEVLADIMNLLGQHRKQVQDANAANAAAQAKTGEKK